MVKKEAEEKASDTKVYLIEFENGRKQKVTIPANWKVTFGPAVPGVHKENGRRMPTAIRFYEDENRQRAIFTDVVSFRDMSIPIEEERVKVETKLGRMEVEGAYRTVNVKAEMREWVNPDKEPVDNTHLLRGTPIDTISEVEED